MKNKFWQLFIKRFYKWLILLCCLIGMLIPLIQVSKSYIREMVVRSLTWDLQESIDMVEHDISKAHQMMNILSSEDSFQNLVRNSGSLPVDQYVYLPRLQTRIAQISIIFELDMMSYLVFRDTPVFISNQGCTNNYTELMPVPVAYAEERAEGWHDFIFESPYSYQLLPNMEFVKPDFTYSGTGIVFIANSMKNGVPNDRSRLVTIIDCSRIVDKLFSAELDRDTFIYILDQNDQILYQYNAFEGAAPEFEKGAADMEINGAHYQLFESDSDLWELRIVCGMSDTVIEQRMHRTMAGWVTLYVAVGTCVVILLSLIFSLKEVRSIGSLIRTGSRLTDAEYTRDEYSFLNNAFEMLDQSNAEKQEKIEVLSQQMEAGVLENLIMRGSYAIREQQDFLKYLNGNFNFYCVTIFSFQAGGEALSSMERQELYAVTEEIVRREALLPDCYSCFLVMAPEELLCVLSLQPDEPVALNRVRSRLLGAMKKLNDHLEQEEWEIRVCAGISKPAQDVANIHTAYLQAKNALSLVDQTHPGEIYQYAPPRTAALKSSFESIKYQYCYDLLIRGDKEGIGAFFDELEKGIYHMPYSDQETMQLFFTLREPIYNAYILIVSNESAQEEDFPAFPQYVPGYTAEQICKDYRLLCLLLCDMVEKNRKSYNDANQKKIMDYLEAHFSDPELTSALVAEHFLVSEKYLYSVVKAVSGKTFGKYIEGLRMQKAEHLLLTTNFTNIQIFQQCGFGSENTFYRNFLKLHGMPPALWKAKMLEETGENS